MLVASGASSMSFQNDLCDLRGLCGEADSGREPGVYLARSAPIIASRSALNSERSLQFGKVDSFAIR